MNFYCHSDGMMLTHKQVWNAIDTIAGWMWMNPETPASGSPA